MALRPEVAGFLRHTDDGAFIGSGSAGNEEGGGVKFFHAWDMPRKPCRVEGSRA
jgi:hypothetical protein